MKRKVEQIVPYLSFRTNILTIPGYRFTEVTNSFSSKTLDQMSCSPCSILSTFLYSYAFLTRPTRLTNPPTMTSTLPLPFDQITEHLNPS